MTEDADALYHVEEEILSCEVPDEALEVAASGKVPTMMTHVWPLACC
jgi:hypothetical protein